MGFTSIVGQSDFSGSFKGSLSCTDCAKILDDITDYIKNSIWLQISDLFSGEDELQVEDTKAQPKKRRSRPWAEIKKVVANTRKARKGTSQLHDTDALLEEELQTGTKNSWSVKKAVKKTTKSVVSTVVDTANTVASSIEDMANTVASLISDWADIEPSVVFSTPVLDGDIDGWKLKVSLTVGVSDVSKDLTVSVAFSVNDMGDAITEAITDAFSAVETGFLLLIEFS